MGNDYLKAVQQLQKHFGNAHEVGRGDIVSSGVLGLDAIMHGGFGFGGVHEVSGKSKTGKSLVLNLVGREVQRTYSDSIVVILDRENAHSNTRLERFGFDMSRTILIPSKHIPFVNSCYSTIVDLILKLEVAVRGDVAAPKTKTDKANLIGRKKLTKSSPHIVFLVDSIPAFALNNEYVEDQGRRAKAWHAVLRLITGALDNKLMLVFSNQVTFSPQAYGGGAIKTTGVAMDYYRDSGVELDHVCHIQDSNEIKRGLWIKAQVAKTRRGAQYSRTMFPIHYSPDPVHRYAGLLDYAVYLGLGTLNNPTAWKDNKGKPGVWPNYKIGGVAINESDPEALEQFVRETDLLKQITDKQLELFGDAVDTSIFKLGDGEYWKPHTSAS